MSSLPSESLISQIVLDCKRHRKKIVELVVSGNNGHIPSAFSIIEIITVLYRNVLNIRPDNLNDPNRNIFILSKGHGCLALYVNLHAIGVLSDEALSSFCQKDGILGEHADATKVPGVEFSGGSLGHGLGFSVGAALGNRLARRTNNIFVLMGDGETHEGTVWEAAHAARNLNLGRLCAIVDFNRSGMQLLPVDALEAKWRAYGWKTIVVDGHDVSALLQVLSELDLKDFDVPTVIIADTIKGKGVEFIEGHGPWHHRIPNKDEFRLIMEALK